MNKKTNAEEKVLSLFKNTSKIIIISLMLILTISMVLSTIRLVILFAGLVIAPDPIPYLINVEDMYTIFSWLLIIIVGYELFKSMTLLLKHDKSPVKAILKIASIAMANKIITLNIKTVDMQLMVGISIILVAVGLAFYFFSKDPDSD